jgi:hypothetical protein
MQVHTDIHRSIRGSNHSEGRLEVIDDIGIDEDDHHRLLETFSLPASVVSLDAMVVSLWQLVLQHVPEAEQALFLCPGNGAWLVEQALKRAGIHLTNVLPIDISRSSSSAITITGNPHHIVVIEDVVETGNTAHDLAEKLAHASCPVTFATTLWHDRDSTREQVSKAYGRFTQVLVAERISSDHPLDDVRSLSTLARKADMPKNQRYSAGCKEAFLGYCRQIRDRHQVIQDLGVRCGYRIDPDSAVPLPVAP